MPAPVNPFQNQDQFSYDPVGQEDQQFYYNQVPEAGYWAWLYGQSPQNWGTGLQARYAQNQYGRLRNQFGAEAASDPFMEWYPWLGKQRNPADDYQLQSPDARGESNYRLYTPRASWRMPGG